MTTAKKFTILFLILLFSLILNMALGSVIISLKEWGQLLIDGSIDIGLNHILTFRVMKALTAIFTGASLALSGLFMQSVFRNPIVGPYVLGTSSAAGLMVGLLILGGAIAGFSWLPDISLTLAGITGSVLSLFLIILFYEKLKSVVSLLIAGLMFGIFTGAIINILSYFTQAQALQKFAFWSMGNLGNQSWSHILLMGFVSLSIFVLSMRFIKKLNALLLGENYAKSLGVNVHNTNRIILIFAGILVGMVTAFVGPIAFIGLAVPHMARLLFKTYLHQILIPATLILGSVLMLLCDTIAQLPGSALTLPINSVTALFGAPLVVYLLLKKTS